MNLKSYAIETFEIAEWNVLKAIMRLKPEDFEKQITSNLNPIRWVIGHLAIHMDSIFNGLCLGERKISKDIRDYFRLDPEKRKNRDFPMFYSELVDTFLKFSKISFDFLNNLPDEKFTDLPEYNTGGNTETIAELIQRISLHFLGHTGQIYQVKRVLGKGGTFVMGVKKKNRYDSRVKWLKWWNDNKKFYLSN
ncbi:MAG: DinB family protein [Candidatus Hodarchaeales archaeon]